MSGFSGHPRGLYVLFATELWERYGFYSMMAILTLYMDEHLHFSQQLSGQVYGGYIAAVYFTPLLGGFLADRVLGYNRSVVIGAVLMGLGYVSLASGTLPLFFTGLGLVALGSGFLKPNISTIVGNLYRDKPQLRDSAFNLFYMGINTGAFLAPIGVAWLRARYGWHVAIASSAVGMVLALVTFIGFNRHVGAAGQRVHDSANPEPDPPADEARRRTIALLVIFAIAVIFWIAFYQNGFTLTFWARDYTDRTVLGREISPETFQSVNPLGIILFSPLLVLAWGWLRDRGAEPSTPGKILIGILFTTASFAVMVGAATAAGSAGKVSPMWLVSSYALIALGEICLSPMGLSLVSKVAPPSRRGLLMGGWFVATSLGGYFSGSLGTRWGTMPHAQFFLFVTLMTIAAAIVLLLVLRFLRPVFARALAERQ